MNEKQDIDQLRVIRAELNNEYSLVREEMSRARIRSSDGRVPPALAQRLSEIKSQIEEVENKIDSYEEADRAENSVEVISTDLEKELEKIREVVKDNQATVSLAEKINELEDISNKTIQRLKDVTLADPIEPKLSILRPKVKLIDANLAYKYADEQSDFNTFLGFTTLFLGSLISFAASLGISYFTDSGNPVADAIYFVLTIMCLLISMIFGILAVRARKKAEHARHEFEMESSEEKEILPKRRFSLEEQE